MKLTIIFILFATSALAQTISPSTATLAPGATQQFKLLLPSGAVAPVATWAINGAQIGKLDSKTGLYTAPSLLPSAPPIKVTIFAWPPGALGARAEITLIAAPVGATACNCKDGKDGVSGKDGAVAGDVFIVSSTPTASATFSKAADGTWTAAVQTTSGFLAAFVTIYRNGNRVAKESVLSLTLSGGKIILTTNGVGWAATDAVTAKWVAVP